MTAHKDYQEELLLKRMNSGVKYTKLGSKFYCDRHSPYGDKINTNQMQAIRRLIEKNVVEFVGNTLKFKDEHKTT